MSWNNDKSCLVISRTGPFVGGKILHELWFQKGPAPIEYFREFGAEFYVHVLKPKRKKLSANSVPGLCVGYCDKRDGYRIYDALKIVISRFKSTVQNERKDVKAEGTKRDPSLIRTPPVIYLRSRPCVGEENQIFRNVIQKVRLWEMETMMLVMAVMMLQMQITAMTASSTSAEIFRITSNIPRLVRHTNKQWKVLTGGTWQAEMNIEIASITENKIFELVPCPQNKWIIGVKWVLKRKKILCDIRQDR